MDRHNLFRAHPLGKSRRIYHIHVISNTFYRQEKGVNIIGVTRGEVTKINHTEKLDQGEVLIAQFTENTSAMKIRGNAEVYTQFGVIRAGEVDVEKV